MESCPDSALSERCVPNVRMERNLGAAGGERRDDIERQSPRIKVEHDVGKQPEIECGDALLCVLVVFRKIERRLTRLRDSKLQIPPAESLGPVTRVIELFSQPRVHVWDVKLFEIVVAVK